jgi:hypothetical protein
MRHAADLGGGGEEGQCIDDKESQDVSGWLVLNWILREIGCCWLNWSGSRKRRVEPTCKHGNEQNVGNFLSGRRLFRKASTPYSYLILDRQVLT